MLACSACSSNASGSRFTVLRFPIPMMKKIPRTLPKPDKHGDVLTFAKSSPFAGPFVALHSLGESTDDFAC